MGIGIWQLVLILAIVVLLFGARKLPGVAGDVAKAIKNFKSGMSSDESKEANVAAKSVEDTSESETVVKKDQATQG
jgi:sec-independent protein translocase protein TatA